MKKNIFNLIALLIAMNTYSQNSAQDNYEEWKTSRDAYGDFDIAKYYTPNIVRNELPINFNFNSNYASSNGESTGLITYGGITSNSYTSKNYDFVGNIASGFLHYVNTRKKISTFGIGLSLNENYDFQKNSQNVSISSDTGNIIYNDSNTPSTYDMVSTNHLDVFWSNKLYFSKLFYFNYQIAGSVDYNFTQNKIQNQAKSINDNFKRNEFVFNFSPRLGIGYGRIEDVEDARQAVYIANALSKRNILTRNISNEELFELSQQISTIKNKRFLDSRLHLTDEISTVDSFFVKKNLLSEAGAAYFTTLYDMWQYGALFPRKSGYEISFSVFPYYTYRYLKYNPELQTGDIYYPHQSLLETNLVFNYEKPVKLNLQHSVSAGVDAFFRQGKSGDTDFNSVFSNFQKVLSAWTSYSFGYYPNTRTNLQATVSQQIRKQTDTYPNVQRDDYTTYNPGFNVGINYYLSPCLRVAGNFGLNYEHFLDKSISERYQNNNFKTGFNVQLIYLIY